MAAIAASIGAWAESNAAWAAVAAFGICFIECVPLASLLLPGSALLLGLGALIGAGALEPLPILGAAVAGAVLGDALSFWIARAIGPRAVRRRVPRRHRRHYARAVLIFRRWGWSAVLAARFISPLRAVAPIAAGVMRMPEGRFQAANICSALLWASVLLMPGYAAGRLAMPLGDSRDPMLLAALGLAGCLLWLGFAARRWRGAPAAGRPAVSVALAIALLLGVMGVMAVTLATAT